tara:strand:+ start:5755 stop:7740 length:1986 start_codon:yes stop_codon:yes gene_type:complete
MNRLFNKIKKIVPKISDTELIALRSGTSSIDRDIFRGEVFMKPSFRKFSLKEQILYNKLDSFLLEYGSKDLNYPKMPDGLLNSIGKNGYFGMIIDEKYGGTKTSITNISRILTKIVSVNPSLGVTIMVPNSLGPGELLENYGTKIQKKTYLHKLAKGEMIPCFGLTGPNNGSDATGEIDTGTIVNINNKLYIDLEINKRYITLAPISNLIGIAFNLKDPNNLLKNRKAGITLALVEEGHLGLLQETYHNPSNNGFPNGTLKGRFYIELDQIIGGEDKIGEGWKMLMECLSTGRAISLPAVANGASKTSLYGTYLYAKHRMQFKRKLIEMQGVREKLVNMTYNTYVIQASISMTNMLLDSGEKPSVISAIMKEQCTERARNVINDGMDINAGSAICLGENNFMEKFYRAIPVGITVEGSNILTRNLIIFGQGLNKSHPFIKDILDSILDDNINLFSKSLFPMINHSIFTYMYALGHGLTPFGLFRTELELQTMYFAGLSNFIALLGGKLKSEQYISGSMANILSNLYLAHSINWYEEHNKISEIMREYCITRLCHENKKLFNNVVDNYPSYSFLLYPFKQSINSEDFLGREDVMNELINNEKLLKSLKEDIQIGGTPLENMEKLSLLEENTNEYKKLYSEIISVGEISISEDNKMQNNTIYL